MCCLTFNALGSMIYVLIIFIVQLDNFESPDDLYEFFDGAWSAGSTRQSASFSQLTVWFFHASRAQASSSLERRRRPRSEYSRQITNLLQFGISVPSLIIH